MERYDPIEVLRQVVKQARDKHDDSEPVRFFYGGNQSVSYTSETFFSFLDEQLRPLQKLIAAGDTQQAVTHTIKFMNYLSALNNARNMPELIQKTRSLTAASGGSKKRGAEGPLKRYVRDVMEDGAVTFEQVLAALEYHIMIAEVKGDSLTYLKKDGSLKTVKLKSVEKAYGEII